MSDRCSHAHKVNTVVFISIVCSLLVMVQLAFASSSLISGDLSYGTDPNYDPNNDGVEDISGAIDFSVAQSTFDASLDTAHVCTWWQVYSQEDNAYTSLCHGYEHCCNFLGMVPTRPQWDDDLYLTYGMYGATENNLVSAQLVHVEYDNSQINPYSNIEYGAWGSLAASFSSGIFSAQASIASLITIGNNVYELTVHDFTNATTYGTGEGIAYNYTINGSLDASISTTNISPIAIASASAGIADISNASGGVLSNGAYEVDVNFSDGTDHSVINYAFTVSDSAAADISLNVSNNTITTTPYPELHLRISSDEFATIRHRLNAGSFSSAQNTTGALDITVQTFNGANMLEIEAVDQQGNNQTHVFMFTVTHAGLCTDGIQNGAETGVDCGGACNACIALGLSFSKSEFLPAEQVFATVVGRTDSYIILNILRDGNQHYTTNITPVFSGAPISEVHLIPNTNVQGQYTATATLHYLNNTEVQNAVFDVDDANPLSISLIANDTTIKEGDSVKFESTVSGNTGSVSYAWDVNDDGSVENTASSFVYEFGGNGTFTVALNVSDGTYNKGSKQDIRVKKIHSMTFTVKDRENNNGVTNAVIDFSGETYETGSSDSITVSETEGSHQLIVSAPNYLSYSKTVRIDDAGFTFVANLSKNDATPPQVILGSPIDDARVESEPAVITFSTIDESALTCKLYFATAPNFPITSIEEKTNLPGTGTHSFEVDVVNGSYRYKIECTDQAGQSNTTEIASFSQRTFPIELNLTSDEERLELDDDTEAFIAAVNTAIENIPSLSAAEKTASQRIDLQTTLERAKRDIARAQRDVASLVWRRLNESTYDVERNKIIDKIVEIKQKTPLSVTVLESEEYVKYPREADVALALDIAVNNTNIKLSKNQRKKLISSVLELQSEATITTTAEQLEYTYYTGETETVTLLSRVIEADDLSDMTLYEIIPKDIAEHINQTTILVEHEVIDEDPVVEINLEDLESYEIIINKVVDLEQTKDVLFVLLPKDVRIAKDTLITGFSIFNFDRTVLFESADTRLIIEILIIVILAGVYLVYSFGGVDKIRHMFVSRDLKDLQTTIDKAQKFVQSKEYELSAQMYKQTRTLFSRIDAKKRIRVKDQVTALGNDVNMLYITRLVAQAQKHIADKKRSEALALYKKIRSLYKIIPPDKKQVVNQQCTALHTLLAGKKVVSKAA